MDPINVAIIFYLSHITRKRVFGDFQLGKIQSKSSSRVFEVKR